MTSKTLLWLTGGLVTLSLGLGLAVLVSATGAQTPQITTTVNVGTGVQGPPGPPGPPGTSTSPAGLECPTGYTLGDLVINHPGGQVTILTCIKK